MSTPDKIVAGYDYLNVMFCREQVNRCGMTPGEYTTETNMYVPLVEVTADEDRCVVNGSTQEPYIDVTRPNLFACTPCGCW